MDLIVLLCSSCSSHQYMAKKVILSNSYRILKSFTFQCLFGKENKQHWMLFRSLCTWYGSFLCFLLILLCYSFIANLGAKFPRDCADCNQQARSLTDTSENKGNSCFSRVCL